MDSISDDGYRNADAQYMISGPDLNKLKTYSEELLKRMQKIPHVVDTDSSAVAGLSELRVMIDRQRAADLGARIGDIAQAMNILVAGQPVSSFIGRSLGGVGGVDAVSKGEASADAEEYDVVLRATGEFLRNNEGLRKMAVPSGHGGMINLDQVVKIEEGAGPLSIDRLNRQRQVTLSANVMPGGSQSEVIAGLDRIVKEMKLAPGYTAGPVGRSKDLGRAGYYFALAVMLSFLFLYIVLAGQFESFRRPATILLTLALAVPFGLLSLLIVGQTINIFSGLGLMLLFGIVTKNVILQIDVANRLRAAGLPRHEAIARGARYRLRPILMTSVAIVAGMAPLLISTGPGSGANRSIGWLVVGGQSFCLPLTLLAAPVFYTLFEDLTETRAWRYAGGQINGIKTGLRERLAQIPTISRFRSLLRRTRRIDG